MSDMDLWNYQGLSAGYVAAKSPGTTDWNGMSSAPKDGTVIEVRCTYGVAPWYGLFRWKNTGWGSRWYGATKDKENQSFSEDGNFTWRPFHGDLENYRDPTGGMQNSMAYWRGAAARQAGQRPDYFEDYTARNVRKQEGRFWYRKLKALLRSE